MTVPHQTNGALVSGLGCCAVTGNQPSSLYQSVCARVSASTFLRPVPYPIDLPRAADSGLASSYTEEEPILLAQVPGPLPETVEGLRRPFPDRPTLMAISAADQALAQSELLLPAGELSVERTRIGVVVGTCFGPSLTVERYLRVLLADGPAQVSPIHFSRAVASSLVGEICRRHQLKGPSTVLLGGSSIGYALDLLQLGVVDAVLCVGVDEVRDLHGWAYRRTGLLDGGLILGEGAGAVVLENASHLQRRKGHALGQVVDCVSGFCPTSVHRLSQVSQTALESMMTGLLHGAQCAADSVGLVIGMAGGLEHVRDTETTAIQNCVSSKVDILWPKHTLGETFGASELLAVVVGTLALETQVERPLPGPSVLVNTAQVGGMVGSVLLQPASDLSEQVQHGT